MRRRSARRSTWASMSADTLVTIAPTLRQATRISSTTALFEHCTASQATVSSKARVCPAPWRAQGTWVTVTPWTGQFTRGASASRKHRSSPTSRARHRRRPWPRSYQGARRPHCPQRRAAPLDGRTATVTVPDASSTSTRSTTVRAKPSSRCHTLVFRTPLALLVLDRQTAQKPRKQAGCARGWTTQAPTDPAGEPDFFDSTSYLKYMVAAGDMIYLATSNNQVWAYDTSSGQLSEVDINTWPAGGGRAGPSGQSINAMAATTSDLVVGLTGGYVYTCSIADGDCNTGHFMTQIDDGGFDANVNALTLVGDTLYIGLQNGAFIQQTLTQGDGSNTVIYNGTTENSPVKSGNNPDSIAGITSADGNVYFGGCLGIVDPVTSDFVGVSTYNGRGISPSYNGCTNPNNANNSEYQGFDAVSNQYALVASTPSSPGGPTVVYLAGHISSGNFVEALENLLPFTASTCLNNVAPCPTKASPTAAVQSPPAPATSLGSLSSPQIQSECGGNSVTGASYTEIPPSQTTASGASVAGDGFQLKAATSTTQSCSTTFAWNLNNAGSFPYGTWSSNVYLDAADSTGAKLSLTVGGASGQSLAPSSLPANGATSVSASGEQLSIPLTGVTALVLTLTTQANSGSSDVLDFTNDTLTPAGQPAPAPTPLSDGTPPTTTPSTTTTTPAPASTTTSPPSSTTTTG